MDVIEIDAASNRGINEMRELRENVRFRPARDRYKVFIVDEAHQITSEAFNALLKTLEEPPEWVVFILCTTESHKIPSTIVSRCQQFSFRSVDFAELVARMEWIMQQEGINADPEVLSVLAQAGEGSVRDSLSALDQAIACCGNKLEAAGPRAARHVFARVTGRGDRRRWPTTMPKNVRRGGGARSQRPQPAAFRARAGALLPQSAGGEDRRAARRAWWRHRRRSRNACSQAAAHFSEDDLTRYLQLSLDLFRDLQSSLQPRLHLEMGLLRMVQAGRLQPIEEALAGLGGSGGTAAAAPPKAAPPKPAPSRASPAPRQQSPLRAIFGRACTPRCSKPSSPTSPTRWSIPNSPRSPNEMIFTTPKMYQLYLKEPEFEAAVKRIAGRTGERSRSRSETRHSCTGRGTANRRAKKTKQPSVRCRIRK